MNPKRLYSRKRSNEVDGPTRARGLLPSSSRRAHAGAAADRRIGDAIALMLAHYGPQGWWPVRWESRRLDRVSEERRRRGYHPEDFETPRTRRGRWEVICGAVLTQNTAFRNVEAALDALHTAGLRSAEALSARSIAELSLLIRPAGYFNQKATYLQRVAIWYLEHDRVLGKAAPSRELLERTRPSLLSVLGIGPETADSILLYAYRQPTFVVDAYTRRVFGRIGLIEEGASYESIRALLESSLARPNPESAVEFWQEAHALIVEHAKRFHARGTDPRADFLLPLANLAR